MNDETKRRMFSYYGELPREARLPGKCSMSIPCALKGKRVLDVMCRKGKGAYELSDYTGENGFVLGVDPCAENIERAAACAADNHWSGNGWRRYLRFARACPEDLSQAGVRDASFDVVYVNSALNVAFDMQLALAEFFRCLTPGGYVWVAQGVFVVGDESKFTHSTSNVRGNVFLSAVTMNEFRRMCIQRGFASVQFERVVPIVPECADALQESEASRFVSADVRVVA